MPGSRSSRASPGAPRTEHAGRGDPQGPAELGRGARDLVLESVEPRAQWVSAQTIFVNNAYLAR